MTISINSWLSDGIIYHDLSGVTNLTKEIIEGLRIKREELASDLTDHYVVSLLEGVLSVDFEAQGYLSDPLFTNKIRASAFVGNGFLFEHTTSMFFWYHKPNYLVQRFSSKEEATAWILEQKKLAQIA